MEISLERLAEFIDDLRDQYQREEEQAILQRNMERAVQALAGKEACTRLKSNLGMRLEMDRNVVGVTSRRKRA